MRYCVVMALAAGLLPTADATKEDAKKDQELLQGTWRCVSLVSDGKTSDAEDAALFSMIFEKNGFTIKEREGTLAKGTFALDPSQKPKAIDVTATEAANERAKGKTQYGIYEVDKDTFKWCSTTKGKEARPKGFSSKGGTGAELWTFKREKK
jgi:uncharacterized protein (TIGR03067 family)